MLNVIIIAVYLITAFACTRMLWIARVGEARSFESTTADRRSSSRSGGYRFRRRFWLALAMLLLALGSTREFNLVPLLTGMARDGAVSAGWHDHRFAILGGIAIVILIVAFFTLAVLISRTRRTIPRERIALIGVGALLIIIILRGLSLHHLDAVMRTHVLRVSLWSWVECTALLAIAVAALRNGWWHDGRRWFNSHRHESSAAR